MGKSMEGWSIRHLLIVSVALNVGLVLKLACYEKQNNFGTNNIFHGFCAHDDINNNKFTSEIYTSNNNNNKSCIMREIYTGNNNNNTNKSCVMREIYTGNNNKFIKSSSMVAAHVVGDEVNNIEIFENFDVDVDEDRVINLDQGDPAMYERYWQKAGNKTTITISGWQSMSYFSDVNNICWFLEPTFAKEVIRLHSIVGNAITQDRHIVVGTGSTQLFQAALYALSADQTTHPINVVSATPYYSFYRQVIEYLKSGLYKWAGDTADFDEEGPYIELITSPNNPDGVMRQPVVNRSGGMLVHDFAYYWPQYTPITAPADHDIMLFTVSKTTGHAGMRIGWALVKDKAVAKRMTKFIELNTIGVSKDSQLRAAKILQAVSDSCEHGSKFIDTEDIFEMSYRLLARRWKQLNEAVKQNKMFSTPEFPLAFCNYSNRTFRSQPAFAWVKCEGDVEDCESFLRKHKVLTRGGSHFGMSPRYVRISMLDRESNYDLFIKRLSMMHS